MAADSSIYIYIYISQMEEYSNQEKDSFMCTFNIIYFLYKNFVQNKFFLFLVYLKNLKKKKIKLEYKFYVPL